MEELMFIYTEEQISLTNRFIKVAKIDEIENVQSLYKHLYTEEAHEALSAWANDDLKEMCDGIGDMMFLNVAMSILGYRNAALNMHIQTTVNIINNDPDYRYFINGKDAHDILLEVCKSNLSKFDNTLEDALETQKHYYAMGVTSYVVHNEDYDLYAIFSKYDQEDFDGNKYNKNKLLKSKKNFRKPELSEIMKVVVKS